LSSEVISEAFQLYPRVFPW